MIGINFMVRKDQTTPPPTTQLVNELVALRKIAQLQELPIPNALMWQVEERPFASNSPWFGSLIVRFRTLWNSIATRWYVLPLLTQQNDVNRQANLYLHSLDRRLIEQDREQVQLTHDLGEITAQLIQTNRFLQSIDQRLANLENGNASSAD